MKIKECAYYSKENLDGTPSKGLCNCFPVYDEFQLNYKFIECEATAINKCPYKQFQLGMINKQELGQKVIKILNNRGNK